ncbi:MAG TPA: hypothetical protein VF575_04905 [Candidatus Saccharimonadales bacterium]|jgi:cytochrome bd-type quinol oxidase subunit 2
MKKYIVGLLMAITMISGGIGFTGQALAAPAPTSSARAEVCAGVNGQVTGGCSTTSGASISKILKGLINLLSVIAGIAAVIMIIISGLKYITSSGEAQAVSSAKRTLIYAVVGLVVVAVSQFIVHFVLTTV